MRNSNPKHTLQKFFKHNNVFIYVNKLPHTCQSTKVTYFLKKNYQDFLLVDERYKL